MGAFTGSSLIWSAIYLPSFFCHSFVTEAVVFEGDMFKEMQRFLKDESGAAAIEYGLITSGISVAIIPSIKDVGVKLVDIFTVLQNAI
jgi:Flp pilus assembly pilin Flp